MKKTLTEQWRNGEIDDGLYYFKLPSGETTITSKWGILGSAWKDTEDKIEVLDPVPSYDEWHKVKDLGLRPDYTDHIEKWEDCARLTKKLEIATKALKEYANSPIGSKYHLTGITACIALKEMEGVK